MIILLIYVASILFFMSIMLWIFVPALYGLPAVPTGPGRIRKALQLANLQPQEVLYDLGAGDGRVLLIAAREFGARAVGIEVAPLQCVWAWLRAAASGVGDRIQVRWGNYYKTRLHEAEVVFVYPTAKEALKLAPYLQGQMKPGARLVSVSADFPEWEPSAFEERALIFVYEMPPKPGSIATYLMKKQSP